MKKLLAMLLALCLLAGVTPATLAEPAIADPAPELTGAELPVVGDVIHGFEAMEIRDYALIDATVVRFEHKKTGAELFYIANDDTNRAFDLTFFTDAIDNTGLPHVFEHATTAGSEKYPSSALWFNLEYQTYNTFFNAMTGKRFTSYPVASLSEAQLLKYADYYTDSCFHPTLMQNEAVYRTEAWRYRLDDADAPLTLEGTVYSEMLGAWSLRRVAYLNALRAMFPGSIVGNDSGGDPDFIPDMTYEMLTSYHDRYYHPSNCAACLYGQFEDYAAFLALLDDCFSGYERREFTRADAGYAPIAAPVVQSLPFPVEQSSDPAHASVIYYGFVCPGLKDDPEQARLLNTMTDLLVDDASLYQQSLRQALPYGGFGAFIDQSGPEYAIVFNADNVDPGDAETFRAAVDAALRDVAENGFPQDQVDGVMATLKINARLIRENDDPVNGIIQPILGFYAETGDPWGLMSYQDGLFRMDEWNQKGLYARAASDWLVDSRTTALITTYPEPGAKEAHDAALAEKLAGVKASMSEAEIAAIVEASNTPLEKEDTAEMVAGLKAVTVESLPEELKRYEVTDETDEYGVRHIDALAGVDGVGQANVFLDAEGLEMEDIHWLQLYTGLIGQLDTAAHDKAELATLTGRYLNNGSFRLSLPEDDSPKGYHPYLRLCWVAMDDDLDEGYDLVREMLFDTKVDDPAKLLEQVRAQKADFRGDTTANPANVLIRRAAAVAEERVRYSAYATDLDFYDFLGRVEALLAEDPAAVTQKLEAIQDHFNNRTNAVTLFAGNAGSIALNRRLADEFLAALDAREIRPAELDLPVPAASEALVIDSGVQYNLLMAGYDALGMPGFTGDLDALTSLVSDTFLVPMLRDEYGVYSPSHGAFRDIGLYLYAYRDPNIAETFAMYDQLPALVGGLEIDQETLDGYIMSAYSNYARPEGALTGASAAAVGALEGSPQDEKLTWMRQLKQATPEAMRAYADLYAKLSENGVRITAGAASAINANADRYEAILNPFGAADASRISFADAPEGSAHYEAVRFAFENRLMAPLSEEEFGVDAPATQGDLLTACSVLIGGEADAHEALAAFVEYGLVSNDTNLSAPIAPDDFWGMMAALTGTVVPAAYETADPAAVTRGEMAEMLKAFMDGMQG